MNDYKPGDRITLRHDDGSRLADREVDSVYSVLVGKRREYVNDLTGSGWVIVGWVPKADPLPEERGLYIDRFGTIWDHNGDGWHVAESGRMVGIRPEHGLPLVRLVEAGSEREQAIRDVLKYIDDFGWTPGQVRIFEYGHAARILEHFGYAP